MATSQADREFHEDNAIRGLTDPEGALAELDAKYHDHLPYGQNCYLCGIEHAAIWPSNDYFNGQRSLHSSRSFTKGYGGFGS